MLLVTGITGKSGWEFWLQLERQAEEVRQMFPDGIRLSVHSMKYRGALQASPLKPELCEGNLENPGYLAHLMNGVDTVVHIAGIDKSLALIKAGMNHGLKRAILVHTTGIYSKYKDAGEGYRQIEAELYPLFIKHHIAYTILRPTMIYGTVRDGNMCVFVRMVDKLRYMPVVNHAAYALQPVHYRDLGRAYTQVLLQPETTQNKEYNLSGGTEVLLIDVFGEIAKNLGVQREFVNVPFPVAYTGAWLLYVLSLGKIDFRERVQRLCEERTFSFAMAQQDFGYAPMSFAEGIREEVEEYKKMKKG